jgi:hypothetical protein
MPDTTSTPPSQTRSCTHPFGMMLQACLAWYRRYKSRPDNRKKRPWSDSTLVPSDEVDEFNVKMGSIPVDSPGITKSQPTPPQPAVSATKIVEPRIFCKYSSEFDRRRWGELQPQVVPADMVLKRMKLSQLGTLPLRISPDIAAHG